MTWFKVKDWKFKNYNELEIKVVESEKIFESEISDIIYDTIPDSVIDDMIDYWYDDAEICGNKYPASKALKSISEIDYNEIKEEICETKSKQIMDEMPDKPATYPEMIDQCKIYWE